MLPGPSVSLPMKVNSLCGWTSSKFLMLPLPLHTAGGFGATVTSPSLHIHQLQHSVRVAPSTVPSASQMTPNCDPAFNAERLMWRFSILGSERNALASESRGSSVQGDTNRSWKAAHTSPIWAVYLNHLTTALQLKNTFKPWRSEEANILTSNLFFLFHQQAGVLAFESSGNCSFSSSPHTKVLIVPYKNYVGSSCALERDYKSLPADEWERGL